MKHLRDLEDEKYQLVTNSQDVRFWLEFYGLEKTDSADDISGAVVWAEDGDVVECYFTESNRPFDLSAIYHPVSFYLEA